MRTIEGFHRDEAGDWIAELSCLHGQHVRHRPPFWERPWVTDATGRAAHLGSALDCPLCDRAELPDGLAVARVAGPFGASTLPAGLRRDHRVADGTWARVRVEEGAVRLTIDTEPPINRLVTEGEEQPIPPAVAHAVHPNGDFRLVVEFLVPQGGLR
jgi:tellurite resistance-related uncharacterized protein